MKNLFAAPIHERIEQAVQRRANAAADMEYRRLLAAYYLDERNKLDPSTSVANAYEYARLYEKHMDNLREHDIALRCFKDATGKYEALVKSRA